MVPVRRNQNWLPSIFNDLLNNDFLMERRNTTAPAVNIIENDDEYKVEVAAPGMTKEDFKVHINEDNELVISMEKHSEEKEEDKKHKGTYLRREFSYTQFQQNLLLPDNVEREKPPECEKKKQVAQQPPVGERIDFLRQPASCSGEPFRSGKKHSILERKVETVSLQYSSKRIELQ